MALLDGKVAIVTGAGAGIGRAHALALAAHGARVVVDDLGVTKAGAVAEGKARADGVVAEIRKAGGSAVACYEDVSDFQAAARIIQAAMDSFGRLDILVNNAGIFRHGFIDEMTEDDFDQVIGTHLKGTFNTCRHAFPIMKAQRYGRIINTVSNQWPAPKVRSVYSAAKGGIASLTWDLALEGRAYGITANAVSPFADTSEPGSERTSDRDRRLIEMGVLGELRAAATEERAGPEYVSPLVVFLASDYAAEVNGRIFRAGAGKIGLYCHPVEVRQVFRDYKSQGPWPIEELIELLPNGLLAGENLAPHLL